MSAKIDDGGSAFPNPYGQVMSDEGRVMTLRDWFAGQASESDVMHWRNVVGIGCTREMAKYAYADAMLAAQKGGAQ